MTVTLVEEVDDLDITLNATFVRYTPFQFLLEVKPDTPGAEHITGRHEFTINADGSVYVSNWQAMEWYRNQLTFGSPDAGVMLLLFAARGHLREVTLEERDRIATTAAHVGTLQ